MQRRQPAHGPHRRRIGCPQHRFRIGGIDGPSLDGLVDQSSGNRQRLEGCGQYAGRIVGVLQAGAGHQALLKAELQRVFGRCPHGEVRKGDQAAQRDHVRVGPVGGTPGVDRLPGGLGQHLQRIPLQGGDDGGLGGEVGVQRRGGQVGSLTNRSQGQRLGTTFVPQVCGDVEQLPPSCQPLAGSPVCFQCHLGNLMALSKRVNGGLITARIEGPWFRR